MTFPNFKKDPIRSTKIRKSAKGKPCTARVPSVCNSNNETTVLAHIDTKSKGMGVKSDDLFSAYMCSACHDWYDGHHNESMRDTVALSAMIETQRHLYDEQIISIADIVAENNWRYATW